MSIDQARRLYEMIEKDGVLQEEFKSVSTEEGVVDKALEVADARGVDVSRADIKTLLQEMVQKNGDVDKKELEDVAGGHSVGGRACIPFPPYTKEEEW